MSDCVVVLFAADALPLRVYSLLPIWCPGGAALRVAWGYCTTPQLTAEL